MLTPDKRRLLLSTIRKQFRLDWTGIHGAPHWARVRWNGLQLAKAAPPLAEIRTDVIELFAFLHDSQREHDGMDPDHGPRAALYAWELNIEMKLLDDVGMGLLRMAMEMHSEGYMRSHPTIKVCWDADRLDLGRVGIMPDPARLCTPMARDPALLSAAWLRSLGPEAQRATKRRDYA